MTIPSPEPSSDDTVAVSRADAASSTSRATGSRQPVPAHVPHPFQRVRVGVETFPLDVPVIVGRRPSSPRVVHGNTARLAAVPSPRGEVSATHVEIRQEGASVVVTDLRSTNGTRVEIPGRQPVALRQGESIVVLAGTIVDIGDGNHLEILPLTRITPQEEPHP